MRLGRLRPKRKPKKFGGNGYACLFDLLFFSWSFCRARALSTSALLYSETDFSGQLQERLQREGVKTHKERVEELNKYLSRLSEHHDMYVLLFIIFYTFVRFLWALRDYKLTCYTGRRLDRAKWVGSTVFQIGFRAITQF